MDITCVVVPCERDGVGGGCVSDIRFNVQIISNNASNKMPLRQCEVVERGRVDIITCQQLCIEPLMNETKSCYFTYTIYRLLTQLDGLLKYNL